MIGPFEFDKRTTDAQRDAVKPVLIALDAVIGSLIEPVTIWFRPPEKMPFYAPRKRAYGLWHGYEPLRNRREIWLRNDIAQDPNEAKKLLAHEVVHVLDDDYMNRDQRRDAIKLMHPQPDKWRDTVINGKDYGYPATPFETFAVYGSTALVDFVSLGASSDKPAYTGIFMRSVDEADWPKLRQVILS